MRSTRKTHVVLYSYNHHRAQGIDAGFGSLGTVASRNIQTIRMLIRKLPSDCAGFSFYDELTATVRLKNQAVKMRSGKFNESEGYWPGAEVYTLAEVSTTNPRLANEMRKFRLRLAFLPRGGSELVPCKYLKRKKGFIIARRVNTVDYSGSYLS